MTESSQRSLPKNPRLEQILAMQRHGFQDLRPKSNSSRLRRWKKILDTIEREREHFRMNTFIDGHYYIKIERLPVREVINSCGTTMCLAGWATYSAFPGISVQLLSDYAEEIGTAWLGLNPSEAHSLFFSFPKDLDRLIGDFREFSKTQDIEKFRERLYEYE